MTDARGPHAGDETEVIPALTGEGVPRTRELPVVDDEPTAVTPPPPPVARPVPPAPTPVPSARPGGVERPWLWALAAAVLVVLIAGAYVLHGRDTTTTLGTRPGAASGTTVPATVSSFDPSGGSGFRQQDGTWRTQTYASADFGNLKDGVGLLLDLGSARAVRAVTVEPVGGAVTVELRAADRRGASASAFDRVGTAVQASGATTLEAGGATHRYWLVWVTRLAAQDGGYRAVLRAPAVRAG